MTERTLTQLERELRGPDEPYAVAPALASIRRRGARRRRVRAALRTGGVVAVVAAISVGSALWDTGPDEGRSTIATYTPPVLTPDTLPALARRALVEVPGAVQVSSAQVAVPVSSDAPVDFADPVVPRAGLAGAAGDLRVHHYTGVTTFAPGVLPAWLDDAIDRLEKADVGPDGGYTSGRTDLPVLVDTGPVEVGCVTPQAMGAALRALDPEMYADNPVEPVEPGQTCSLHRLVPQGEGYRVGVGMGSDDFLEQGQGLELFEFDDWSSGYPRTAWVGGLHGTDAASVELITTDGRTTSGTVATDVVPGGSVVWGTVDGELARVVVRDAEGRVLDDHPLRPCSGGSDCEVR